MKHVKHLNLFSRLIGKVRIIIIIKPSLTKFFGYDAYSFYRHGIVGIGPIKRTLGTFMRR